MKSQLQKNLSALLIIILFSFSVANAQIIVQFTVDMSGQTIGAGGLHVAGQFAKDHSTTILQDWAPGAAGSQLTLLTGTFYTLQVSFPSASAGDSLQFQFVKDSTWDDASGDASEGNPGDCCLNELCGVSDGGGGYNRLLIIPDHSESFVAAWNQCGTLSDSLCFFPLSPITRNGNQLCIAAYSSYEWELNGIAISGATNQCYAPTETGSYAVEVSDSGGCKETSTSYFFITSDHGPIIYTDVIPDGTITSSGSYPLDINHDGIIDYSLNLSIAPNCHSTTNFISSITFFGGNSVAHDSTGASWTIATEHDTSDSINSRLLWSENGSIMLSLFSDVWHFAGFPPKLSCVYSGRTGVEWDNIIGFVALRLYFNGQFYYGWVRIKVTPFVSITVYDYAYNSIPGAFILAGDTGSAATGIFSPEKLNQFSVYPNPTSDKITLSFSSTRTKQIQITNLLGQIVFSEKINTIKQAIDISQFPKGMYLISVKTEEQNLESKFLKQ